MSITPNYFHSSRNVSPLDLSYRPTVAELRKYLAHYGVTVPSRLRKDALMAVALDVRFSDVDTVERYVAKLGGTISPVTVPAVEAVEVERPVLVSIPLTPFQRDEVEHGIDVDFADNNPTWGTVRRTGKTTSFLDVLDFDGAVYRMTSGRDILSDNSTSDFGPDASTRSAAAGARSLTALITKLIDAAGGPDSLDATARRWVRPGDYTPVPAVEVDAATTVPVNTAVTVERSDGPCPGWLMGTVLGTDRNGAVEVDYDNPISTDPGVRVLVECDDNCYSHLIVPWSRVTVR